MARAFRDDDSMARNVLKRLFAVTRTATWRRGPGRSSLKKVTSDPGARDPIALSPSLPSYTFAPVATSENHGSER